MVLYVVVTLFSCYVYQIYPSLSGVSMGYPWGRVSRVSGVWVSDGGRYQGIGYPEDGKLGYKNIPPK